MGLHIQDAAAEATAQELAALTGLPLIEALRLALDNELRRRKPEAPLQERLKALAEDVARAGARASGGAAADKDFYDALSGED